MRRVTGRLAVMAVTAATAALLGSMSGCAASATEPEGLATVTATATSTPSQTETPTVEGPRDLSDPELGIVFASLPEATGTTKDAVETYAAFEVEFWRALRTGDASTTLQMLASADSVEWVQAQLDGNATAGDWLAGGTMTTALVVDVEDAAEVVLAVCRDMTAVTFTDASGATVTAVEGGIAAQEGFHATLRPTVSGGWTVDAHDTESGC